MNREQEVSNICEWIKDYVEKSGTKGVVLGVSGGIDSAVVAALCVKAIGRDNVYALMMPPNDNANLVCDKLELNCAPYSNFLYEAGGVANYFLYRAIETQSKTKEERDLVAGNVASRLRMIGLYAWANLKNYLVVGTTNKSEYEIGYYTKYGDGGVDFEPIGDYYKTEVYELAKYLKVPQEIIDTVPSADLWDGQTDEDEIGMRYERLDEFLPRYQYAREDPPSSAGFDNICKMIKQSRHKKNMPPSYKRSK